MKYINVFHLAGLIILISFYVACSGPGDKTLTDKSMQLVKYADSLNHSDYRVADSVYRLVLQDSLRLPDDIIVKAIRGLAGALSNKGVYDTSLILLNSAATKARLSHDTSSLLNILLALGNLSIDMGQSERAENFFTEGLEISEISNSLSSRYRFLLSLGSIHYDRGELTEAVRTYTQGLQAAEEAHDPENQAVAMENLSHVLMQTGDFPAARAYIEKSLKIQREMNLLNNYALNLQNLGIYYRKTGMIDSALMIYHRALETLTELGDSMGMIIVRYNIGIILKNQKKFGEAEKETQMILSFCKRKNVVQGQIYAWSLLASIYENTGRYREALTMIDSAIQKAETNKLIMNIVAFTDRKHEILSRMGLFEEAYNTALRSRTWADSLLSLDKQTEITGIRTRFETDRKEAENTILKKSVEVQKVRLTFLQTGMILIILLAGALIVIFVGRQRLLRQQKQLTFDNLIRSEQEQQIQAIELEKSKTENQIREQELVFQALVRKELSNVNRTAREKLLPFYYKFSRKKDQGEFLGALNEINRDSMKDPLEEFELLFTRLHNSFFEKLLELNPDISRSELQVSAMIRLNLSSKDIARLTGLSVATIETTRHHIRRKLGLETGDNLTAFMISL